MGFFSKIKGFANNVLVSFNLVSDVPDIPGNTKEFYEKIRRLYSDDNEIANELIELITKGIDINGVDSRDGNTALYKAVLSRHSKVVEALITKNADPDIRCNNNTTPLISAIMDNQTEIIRILLTIGKANPDIQDDGITALHWAVMRRNIENIKLLFAAKANLNIQDSHGSTPLHIATMTIVGMQSSTSALEVITMLLNNNASINIKDKEGHTPLSMASQYSTHDLVFKPFLQLIINTIKNRLEDSKFGAIENENQLFDEINSYIEQDNLKINTGEVTDLIDWLVRKDDETKEARKKALEHIENVYSCLQTTGAFNSYRLRDRLLDAIDYNTTNPNALCFQHSSSSSSNSAQHEPNAALTVGAPCLRPNLS